MALDSSHASTDAGLGTDDDKMFFCADQKCDSSSGNPQKAPSDVVKTAGALNTDTEYTEKLFSRRARGVLPITKHHYEQLAVSYWQERDHYTTPDCAWMETRFQWPMVCSI